MNLSAAQPLSTLHTIGSFDCGNPDLNNWLLVRARKAEGRSARVYVVSDTANEIAAYYTLSAMTADHSGVPKNLSRNMPTLIPLILLGRLAVDLRFQGIGLGKSLMRDAMQRALAGGTVIGARALMIHALDPTAARFYQTLGFIEFPSQSLTFFMPLETIALAFQD